MLLLYFHYTDNSYYSDDIPLSQLVFKRKAEAYEEDEIWRMNRKNIKNLFTELMMKVCVFLFDFYYVLMIELLQ